MNTQSALFINKNAIHCHITEWLKHTCRHCCHFSWRTKLKHHCADCSNVWYCTDKCQALDEQRHVNECQSLLRFQRMRKRTRTSVRTAHNASIPQHDTYLDNVDFTLGRLLVSVVCGADDYFHYPSSSVGGNALTTTSADVNESELISQKQCTVMSVENKLIAHESKLIANVNSTLPIKLSKAQMKLDNICIPPQSLLNIAVAVSGIAVQKESCVVVVVAQATQSDVSESSTLAVPEKTKSKPINLSVASIVTLPTAQEHVKTITKTTPEAVAVVSAAVVATVAAAAAVAVAVAIAGEAQVGGTKSGGMSCDIGSASENKVSLWRMKAKERCDTLLNPLASNRGAFSVKEINQMRSLCKLVLEACDECSEKDGAYIKIGRAWTVEELIDIVCKEECNSFGLRDDTREMFGYALVPGAARLNHNCEANVKWHIDDSGSFRFVCNQNVQKAEQLFISYAPNVALELRQMHLSGFQFKCECERCLRESLVIATQ